MRNWPGFNLPVPDWYEGDLTEEGYFWTKFDENQTGPYAMDAIRAITRAGHPLPEELHIWVDKAIDAWRKAEGNKVEVRSKKVRERMRMATHQVWMKFLRGSKIDDATFEVAEKLPFDCDADSLRTEYYRSEERPQRKREEESLILQRDKALREDRQDEAEALEKEFPRLFHKQGN